MYDAMQHPLFASLRLSPAQAALAASAAPQSSEVVRYLHYYRSPVETGGATVDALPIV
jgi:hypothetical protein